MGRKGEKELAKIEEGVRQQVAAGHTAFVVPVYCMADGIGMWKLERMKQAGQQLLLDMGLRVTGMTYDEWKYTAYFEVQVPQRREPEKKCPKCAETIKAQAVLCRFCGSDLGGFDKPQASINSTSTHSISSASGAVASLAKDGSDRGSAGPEVLYDLSSWSSESRSKLTRELDGSGIKWFWRRRQLVVYGDDERAVDELIKSRT